MSTPPLARTGDDAGIAMFVGIAVGTVVILMIDGETEIIIDGKTYKAGPGDFYIIESGELHGVANATDKPCSYFAFKWR